MAGIPDSAGTPTKQTPWYKNGVIYELHVRAFQDSDGDGGGDFRGLTSRLDYLRDLGVTALWVLPFYPSPLKDDGYDISDYYGVHPNYGTLSDFKTFLREAHRRGLRVITELVLNHTSDQHQWFQRARRAKPGSRWRDYYVWNDTPEKYKGTRIIFKDTEISNWTWDPLAKAYFWHRFYSHQPDLNFDNPVVHDEMYKVVDFWLDMGVDGVRLDAVPYLYEREGTSCENLPETHEFLKRLRKHVDTKFSNRMLLGEANQWPDDAVAYFGSGIGDECHMAFHFPLMPRLFMSLRMEDRVPIVDIIQQTPAIPETAQWALFLRNHDELTLEMVTDEERDYMYRMYAQLQQARLNLGIRRRLAPLVGNERKRIELLSALLFSLPGTPVMYYGDEIGMGENIYLGDRNGVRTPMQWSADKNAGFSRANPQSLYLPINLDPENHYEAVNVEVQERNPHSLLWWMKRLIALRKRWQAFGLGTLEFLQPENRKVLVFVRRYQDECVLVVANLSRFSQPVELDLSAFQSFVPIELFGRTEFPAIGELPYFLTLSPHAFYWFSLEKKAPARVESAGVPVGAEARAVFTVEENWQEILQPENQFQLERALQSWLPSRRWFSGKGRAIRGIHVQQTVLLQTDNGKVFLTFAQVEYVDMDPEVYVVPLGYATGEHADVLCRDWPPLVLARLTIAKKKQDGVLYDAIAEQEFSHALLRLICSRRNNGELAAVHTANLRHSGVQAVMALQSSVGRSEQSNSTIIYGEQFILKFFRRLDFGTNPDLEITNFLTERKFQYSPHLVGAIEYRSNGTPCTIGMLTTFVPGSKLAWEFTMDALSRFYERIQTLPEEKRRPPALPAGSITKLASLPVPDEAKDMIGSYLESAAVIGERTAALHLVLASETDDVKFTPEPFTSHSQRGLFQSMRNLTRRNLHLLGTKMKSLPADVQPLAKQVIDIEPELLKKFRAIYTGAIEAVRTRHHGDYHLGQLLYTGKEFLIIDFEGEPEIPISERRLKRSPLEDVAAMVRSFHHVADAALQRQSRHGTLQPRQLENAAAWGRFWSRWVSATFYKAYLKAAGAASFVPADPAQLQVMMDVFLLRKNVYELGRELEKRPDWVKISLQEIIEVTTEGAAA